jgi:hypothetical protein
MSGYIGNTPIPQATQTRDSFTATASQTSFATGGYTPNFLDVYLNGLKLNSSQFTATNGTDVVLTSAASANDIVEVIAYTAFEVADASFDELSIGGDLTVGGTVDGRDIAADGTKLDGIESGATGDQTNAEIRAAVEAATDSNVFTDADHTKLNAIEASATADQTAAEIRTLVESATDSNVFTDADHTKLNGIEASATADQTKSDIDALNINADTLDGQHGSYYTGYADTAVANIVDSAPGTLDTLNELAAALGDDPNFATTVTNSIATKLPLAGGTLTGDLILSEGSPTITLTDTDGNTSSHIKTVGSNMELHAQHGNMRFRVGSSGLEHMRIAPGGDISFYEDTGTTAKFFWDASAERLGLGTTSPLSLLDVTLEATGQRRFLVNYDNSAITIKGSNASSNPESLRAVASTFKVNTGTSGSGTERMRIDSSGNVLVGTTTAGVASSSSVQGIQIAPTTLSVARSGGQVAFFNRQTNDGAIVDFRKDGSTVGSIGTISSLMTIGTGTTGLIFDSGQIYPWNTTTNAAIDASKDLGASGARFKDLYLSGNAYANTYRHDGDSDTYLNFPAANQLSLVGGGATIVKAYKIAGAYGVLEMHGSGSATYPNFTFNGDSNTGMYRANTDTLAFTTGGTERMRINASGDILGKTADVRIGSDVGAVEYGTSTGNSVRFYSNDTERMRIDSSGNLLVGKTSTAVNTQGIQLGNNGRFYATSNGAESAVFNRKTSDGTIADFRKDNSSVGSIFSGHGSTQLGIGTNTTGITFNPNTRSVMPADPSSTNPQLDATIDLGFSSVRWKDLYLSGGLRSDTLKFSNLSGTERMRIDSSGNLLVGKTSSNAATAGHEFLNYGRSIHTVNATTVQIINRLSNDGDITIFQKDGTTVGAIGVLNSNNLTISGTVADHGGLQFGTHCVIPMEANVDSNGTINLGSANSKFKDGHFSGSLYGDGSNLTGVGGSTSLGAVGTYALLNYNTTSTAGFIEGTTVSGSSLRYANSGDYSPGTLAGWRNSSPSGTWRLMGNIGYYSGTSTINNTAYHTSVFVRIS